MLWSTANTTFQNYFKTNGYIDDLQLTRVFALYTVSLPI